ncbi:MAG: NAD(P)/FAD-dependent oxidoreductase [Pelagimonas sp.]|uniref:NAD(P)/FAD-dependent oxidoreductase n=1 Tax=Pelagimonas sp. TaxID=2073170 RepID=UPI003D6B953E
MTPPKSAIIIGAGIVGASLGYHLSKFGIETTLIDAAAPGAGATGQSFSWINANYAATPEYFALRMQGLAAYDELSADLGAEFGFRKCGSLYYGATEAELTKMYQQLRRQNYPVELIGKSRFMQLEPLVAEAPDICVYSPIEGALDPVPATNAFLKRAVKSGSKLLLGCEFLDFLRDGKKISGINTTFGTLSADVVVVAAGVNSGAILSGANVHLPMDNGQGVIVHTEPVKRCIEHLIMAHGVHVRQELDGRLIAGEKFSGGLDPKNPTRLAAVIEERLRTLLPSIEGISIRQIMTGTRPMPADGFPAVGYVTECEDLYVATTHSGITLAPIIGKLVADEIANGNRADLLKPFGPDRFREDQH